MKGVDSSDSMGVGGRGLISMCTASDEHGHGSDNMYSMSMSMLDDLDEEVYIEESGNMRQKKRRLALEQVKALENYFEVENKLEPERKLKLARELGLQPRQVAVWFQNRRARWKTKQLERDYGLLKSNFDSLKHNYDSLQHHKDTLLKEIKLLKSKLNEESTESDIKVVSGNNMEPVSPPPCLSLSGVCHDPKVLDSNKGVADRPSESDSSAILNEDNNNSPNASNCCGGGVVGPSNNVAEQVLIMSSSNSGLVGVKCCSSSIKCFSFTECRSEDPSPPHNVYYPEFVKVEEQKFLSGEEACNFFSDDAAPTLQWYCSDQWT